ncbi:MAG: UDP-N-acetylmuramoyl-tripeptide--D-alanyl-D-alanine ligase [Flavobacteriaceae bacterium]|nr:UDP-N-acetylmuramoyl-tripeptide--D-alanyl-D-alanine ligase [Flavobacteriaceae bacterium]
MDIQELYLLYKQSYAVSTDTRKIVKNCIFFALKGDTFNGNRFAEEALQRGASYAVVDEEKYAVNERIILVDNALSTLQQLATYHRQQLGLPILALTGSNGKTTTKELISAVLSRKFKTVATAGNLNNHIGVPLTLLSVTPDSEFGIIEMGANHLKEIEFLCEIARPDYGYITNFGKAHLEGFGSLEGVVRGKTELYTFLKENNRQVFVNINDDRQVQESMGMQRITFGNTLADVDIKMLGANPFVIVQYKNKIIQSQLIGAYNYNNIAAAIAIGNYFKVDDLMIAEAIEGYLPRNNRSQIIQKGTNKIILDAYNANPSSMQAAIENFSDLSDRHKIAILGDMFELGMEAEAEHLRICELAKNQHFDAVYLIGKNFYETDKSSGNIHFFETFDDFKLYLENNTFTDCTILIKASRGMALERVLDYL